MSRVSTCASFSATNLRVPISVAVGPDGEIFVADQGNDRIQKFGPDGRFITAFGHAPHAPGYSVGALAVAQDGTVYVTDPADQRVKRWQP